MSVRPVLAPVPRAIRRAALAAALSAFALPVAAAPGSLLEIVFDPPDTSQLALEELKVRLDGADLRVEWPAADAETAELYSGVVKPGPHRIDIEAAFTGKSSVFSYVDGYVFRMRGQLDVEAPAGEAVRVDAKVVRVSGITVKWTDRNRLSLRAGTHPSERAAAAQLPDPAEPAAVAAAPDPAAAAVAPAIHAERGPACTLEPPRFATGSHELDATAREFLDRFAECLVRNEDAAVIEGFADPTGSPSYNEWLSEMRALNAVDHLVKRGVERSRLTIRPLGATRLVCTEANRECRARNRRAEAVSIRR
jgi:peptidoglycan-associated lipoprotein